MSYYGNSYEYGAPVQVQAQAQPQRYYGGPQGYGVTTQAQAQNYYDKPYGYGYGNTQAQAQSPRYYGGSQGYGAAQAQPQLYNNKPSGYGPQAQQYQSYGYGSPNNGPDLVESMIGPGQAFPPGTDPKIIECYNRMDRDGNGVIDDRELQSVLSSISQQFSLRTVHLLMCSFTYNTTQRTIGPKEFIPLIKCLQEWRSIFQRFDRDRNGRIDALELRQVFQNLGYPVTPVILNLLISKFDKSGAMCSIGYDNFIECCITVKGLSDKYRAKVDYSGSATFTYEEFILNVLPFIVA